MNLITWNVKGLHKVHKHRETRKLIRDNNVCHIVVLKNRVKENNARSIINSLSNMEVDFKLPTKCKKKDLGDIG